MSELEIGRTKAWELAKEPWLVKLKRAEGWDADEVRSAIAAREKRDPKAPLLVHGEELDALIGGEDPLAVARAALKVASQRLAAAEGDKAGGALEGVKRALEELRRTEDGYLELAKKKGELIDRDVAKQVIGEAVLRSHKVLERFEVQLAPKVEEWLTSAEFNGFSSGGRARLVRAWAHELGRSVRDMTAAEIESLIAAEILDRA